ncbi:hypothetical protein B0T14DRAFT_572175 [Immersiella caudata]|uniref:MARVEL domain-containing protein n=1 Tax=Immersiella caudata TaxID=314043 RepID=A0AA39TLH7_9PEZI|nr:hypothetical protein B0T14DRAFT_572175 [Immersiella caudata]
MRIVYQSGCLHEQGEEVLISPFPERYLHITNNTTSFVQELVCSAVLLGIVTKFINSVIGAGGQNDSRLIYTLIVASISTVYSLLFMAPFLYTFLAFPADISCLSCGSSPFCLLATRVATNTCNALWYSSYWGYYWGNPWYYDPIGNNIGYASCPKWRAVLVFSFMAAVTYLVSSILGLIVVVKHYKVGQKNKTNP